MKNSTWFAVLAAFVFFAVWGLPNQSFVSFVGADNASSATLTVAGLLDTTINCSTINLGTGFTVNTNNGTRPDTQQCKMTINSNTNTITTISVNSSTFVNNTVVFGQQNVTYSNNSYAVVSSSCLTAFVAGFYSGHCATPKNYTDWVSITPTGAAIDRSMFFNVTIPDKLPKGTYSGSIYIKFLDVS